MDFNPTNVAAECTITLDGIASRAPFVFEPGAEFRAPQMIDDPWRNPARNVDATARAEHQRDISGNRTEHGAEHVERSPCGWARASERRRRDFRGVARKGLDAIERRDRAI